MDKITVDIRSTELPKFRPGAELISQSSEQEKTADGMRKVFRTRVRMPSQPAPPAKKWATLYADPGGGEWVWGWYHFATVEGEQA